MLSVWNIEWYNITISWPDLKSSKQSSQLSEKLFLVKLGQKIQLVFFVQVCNKFEKVFFSHMNYFDSYWQVTSDLVLFILNCDFIWYIWYLILYLSSMLPLPIKKQPPPILLKTKDRNFCFKNEHFMAIWKFTQKDDTSICCFNRRNNIMQVSSSIIYYKVNKLQHTDKFAILVSRHWL